MTATWDIWEPTGYERLTCTHCKKRRKVARWYISGVCGPMFPTCSECRNIEPVEGRDYTIGAAEEVLPEVARAVLDFFNPGYGALVSA